MRALALASALMLAQPVAACDLALVLAIDVSGSVDPDEYRIQVEGLAEGLLDPIVSEALVREGAALTLIQWTGTGRQTVTLDWTLVRSFAELEEFAAEVGTAPRRWRNFSTAIGEALEFSLAHLTQAPECNRRVIDISGDGSSNEGVEPRTIHPDLKALEVTVNALVIEGSEDDLTAYYWENVITGEGAFVETANGYAEYAERIRLKLRRETAKALSSAPTSEAETDS